MSASRKVHSTVMKQVRQANPREDIRRQRAFAWAVAAVILTGKVSLTRWVLVVISKATADSTLRRLWRFLNNRHVDVGAYYEPFLRRAIAGWSDGRVLLAIDPTTLAGKCVVCRISLIYRGRAIPVVWKTFETKSCSLRFDLYRPLLDRARALLPASCQVTLLADRGFGAHRLLRYCRDNGLHFVIRLKSNRHIIGPDGSRVRLTDDPIRPSHFRSIDLARLPFGKNSTFGPVFVHTALSLEEDAQVWHLVSDCPDTLNVLADYRCRMQIDHSFKDDKSGGFEWEQTHLVQPDQVDRMLLVLAVATLYLVSGGVWHVAADLRRTIDPHTKRGLSYLQIGLRAVQRVLHQGLHLKIPLHLDPVRDPDPVAPYGIPFKLFGTFTWFPGPSVPLGC